MDVLANLIALIGLQYICVSNDHLVHLTLTQCYKSSISQYSLEK